MLRKAIAAALLVSAAAGAQPDQSLEAERILESSGYPRWEDSLDWFDLPGTGMRILVPDGSERDTIWDLLEAAAERGVALGFRIDAAAGRLNSEGTRVAYPLCSIVVANGARFGDEARNCPPGSGTDIEAERLLALGVAEVQRDPDRARRTLARALGARPGLSQRGEGLALQARGRAAEAIAEALEPGDHLDRLLAEALADYRRLAALAPDRMAPQFWIASALQELGGYEEALEIFQAIARRWPEEGFETAVAIGALHRQRGDYARALRQLDDLPSDAGSFGMKFYYHRAWTLTLLRRDEEALADLDRGLETQPDYPGAYMLRSCLMARRGRLENALADQERTVELLGGEANSRRPAVRAMIEQSLNSAAVLRVAIASRRGGPMQVGCDFLNRWSLPRARSPLLPAADAPSVQ